MEEKNNPQSNDEFVFTPYPSLEKAEENLRYRTLLNSRGIDTKVNLKKTARTTKPKKEKSKDGMSAEKEELVKLVKAAKLEELSDKAHSGRSPTIARKNLIDKFMSMYHRGIKLSEKQLNYTMNFLYWHPEAVQGKYIRFLVSATVDTMGYPEAVKMTNELANVLEDTKYGQPLREYGKWLKKKSIIVRIAKLREDGLNTDQISEKLHISSAEISILSNDNEKFIFKDIPGR